MSHSTSARTVALEALVAVALGRTERLRTVLDGRLGGSLSGRDHAFAFELAHGVMRRLRFLDHVLAALAHRGLPKDLRLLMVVRLGAYQLLFMPGMPPHAAVHATVELLRRGKAFANAMLRRLVQCVVPQPAAPEQPTTEFALEPDRMLQLPAPLPADCASRFAVVHSLPDFLVQRWFGQLGADAARQVASAASVVPAVFLRASSAIGTASLRAELATDGVETEPTAHAQVLRWCGGSSPFKARAYDRGHFVAQDPTALRAVEAVPCGPGDTVIDLCAAPGTKTTWLGERVRPGGKVYAFDIDEARRARIGDNVSRLGLQDVVQVVDEIGALPVADAVLVDAPCSNTGVLARRVEVRQRLRPDTFGRLSLTQQTLLRQAARLCRPGGAIVYSTCSIEREENEDVVAALLADRDPPCELVAQRCTLPAADLHDGGFFALLRRLAHS